MTIGRDRAAVVLGLLCSFALGFHPVFSQEEAPSRPWKPLLGLEYVSRTIAWDENARSSRLGAAVGLAGVEVRLFRGFTASVLMGYSFSNWNGLVFRGLPFSIDYEAGTIGGIMAGGGVEALVARAGDWEFALNGRFIASLGSTKTLSVEDLNEDGAVDVRGVWMRIQAGPVVSYRGFEAFSPFLSLSFDRLWGKVTMDETIRDLTGTEEKKVAGKGLVAVAGGVLWEPSPAFGLKLAGTAVPYKKLAGGFGLDIEASLRAVFSF